MKMHHVEDDLPPQMHIYKHMGETFNASHKYVH